MKLRIKPQKKPDWFAWLEVKPVRDEEANGKLVGVKVGKVYPEQVVNYYDPRPFFSDEQKAVWKKYGTKWEPPAFAEPADEEARKLYAECYPDDESYKAPKAAPKSTAKASSASKGD